MTFFLGNWYLEAHNDLPALVPGHGCLVTHVYDLCFSAHGGVESEKSHEDYDEKKGAKMMKSSLYEKKKELMLITNGEDDIYIYK